MGTAEIRGKEEEKERDAAVFLSLLLSSLSPLAVDVASPGTLSSFPWISRSTFS